ncbi:hypothetical protein CVT25_007356 [Psilocybe cyanescens]|uniref:Uncharacterized protein n=1 Tax=Psilocybe cyanescens TaxID=93625 RepID=A0A409XJI0_PSICY|nr:hypothetical protein CVT25_007356 [Psilocybe cyanescens]
MEEGPAFFQAIFNFPGTVSPSQSSQTTSRTNIDTKGQPALEPLPWANGMYKRPTLSEVLFSDICSVHNITSSTGVPNTKIQSASPASGLESPSSSVSGLTNMREQHTLFDALFNLPPVLSVNKPYHVSTEDVTALNAFKTSQGSDAQIIQDGSTSHPDDISLSSAQVVHPAKDFDSNDANPSSMPSFLLQQSLPSNHERVADEQTKVDSAVRERDEQLQRIVKLEQEVSELKELVASLRSNQITLNSRLDGVTNWMLPNDVEETACTNTICGVFISRLVVLEGPYTWAYRR